MNLSSIFRDSFVNIIELLDSFIQRAAAADEPETQNIRKHSLALQAQGIENPSARLFSKSAGDFGSMVDEIVVDGSWESGEELGQNWRDRNVFSL